MSLPKDTLFQIGAKIELPTGEISNPAVYGDGVQFYAIDFEDVFAQALEQIEDNMTEITATEYSLLIDKILQVNALNRKEELEEDIDQIEMEM